MSSPRITVDLGKIRHNARHLVRRLDRRGISVTAVTKGVCGSPEIARAMLDGGVARLGDARISNIERMRRAGIASPIVLIRTPLPSQCDRVTAACGTSFNTEIQTIHRLAASALRANSVHGVILMAELGDLREGIMPGDLEAFARKVMDIRGVALKGIGANFACLGSRRPDARAMAELLSLAATIEGVCGRALETVSGGNSANLSWAFGLGAAGRVNDLRLGEAILLGVDPVSGECIEGLFDDAFTLVAEVIESGSKPDHRARSAEAEAGLSRLQLLAGGSSVRQSILALGYQDTDIKGLVMPLGLSLIGATSDHLVVNVSGASLAVGAEVSFRPNYSALMRAMNAPDIRQELSYGTPNEQRHPAELPCSALEMT